MPNKKTPISVITPNAKTPNKKSQYIGFREDAEKWQLANKYIETGFRIGYDTNYKVYKSVFEFHNETGNIWSHLIGALIFVALAAYIALYMEPKQLLINNCPTQANLCTVSNLVQPEQDTIHLQGSFLHSFYNHHAAAFDIVEQTVKFSLTQIQDNFSNCVSCLEKMTKDIPFYINDKVSQLTAMYESENPKYLNQKIARLQQLGQLAEERLQQTHYQLNETQTYQQLFSDEEIETQLMEVPRWPLYLQAFAVSVCFGMSAYYHSFNCKCQETMLTLRKLDLIGICFSLIGSSTAPFYYGFMCKEMFFYQRLWIGLVWSCCLFALAISLSPQLRGNFNQSWIVAGAYIAAGYSTAPGFFHMWFFMDRKYLQTSPVWTFVNAGFLCALGGVIYSFKWPERQFKVKFDYLGNSHNLFHLFSILASLVAMRGSIRMYHERQLYQCPV